MTADRPKRKLAAILSADVKGYSRLMADDDEATVRTINDYREVMTGLITDHNGRVADAKGDNVLAEFPSVVDAVRCAVEIQNRLKERNTQLPEHRRMEFRIGINLGDVIEEGDTIYGDGVNVAARLEGLAEGGGICISGAAFDQVKNRVPVGYEYQGEQSVKNIPDPVRVYKVLPDPEAPGQSIEKKGPGPAKKRWAAVAAAVVLIVAAGGVIWNFYLRPDVEPASKDKMAFPLPDKPSIAVLPFDNMSGDPGQDFLADGITENIITALSSLPSLFVIARNSTFAYKGKPVKVQQVAEELGVRYVIEGSVARSGDRIRVTVQLIDAVKGHHIWANRYDREIKDLFALQDEMAMKLVNGVGLTLIDGEDALHMDDPKNIEVFLKLMQAIHYIRQFNIDDNNRARLIVEQCISLEPDYYGNYIMLGGVNMMDYYLGSTKNPTDSIKTAIEYLEKAAGLTDKGKGQVLPVLGNLYAIKRDYKKAIEVGEQAIAMAPNGADAHAWLAMSLNFAGRPEDALLHFQKAMRLNPLPPSFYYLNLGHTYRQLGRLDEAATMYKKTIALTPNNIFAYASLAGVYGIMGLVEEAKAAGAEVLRINPKWSIEYYAKRSPWKDKKQMVEGLRKAGLPEHPPLPLPDKPSIAVLPFTNMSGDPEQEYFSDGITEEIITALSKTPRLFVIARNSTFTYKGKPVKVQQVGRELGVKYVLEGSVRKAGDRVRITAQLIDAPGGTHIWAERYDRPLGEIFTVQDEITLAIVRAMRVTLTEGEQARLIGKGTKNLDAYLKAMQAQQQFYLMNNQGSVKAKEFARAAIALDSTYAFPYTILANTYMLDAWFNFSGSPEQSMRLAADAAGKALALDDSDPDVYCTLTNLDVMQKKYDDAIKAAERGLQLNPGGARAHISMGIACLFACRFSEAIPFCEQAMRLNPYPPHTYYRLLGAAYRLVGRFDEAIAEYKKALRIEPKDLFTRLGLVVAYIESGRDREAKGEAEELLKRDPKFSVEHFAQTLSFKDQSVVNDIAASLRNAGLK